MWGLEAAPGPPRGRLELARRAKLSVLLKEGTEFFKAGGADFGREGAVEVPDEESGRIIRTVAIVRMAIVRAVNRISTIVVTAK